MPLAFSVLLASPRDLMDVSLNQKIKSHQKRKKKKELRDKLGVWD